MFCPNCGQQVTGKFCTNCGTRLDLADQVADAIQDVPQVEEQIPNHSLFFFFFLIYFFGCARTSLALRLSLVAASGGPLFIARIGLLILQSTGPRALGL